MFMNLKSIVVSLVVVFLAGTVVNADQSKRLLNFSFRGSQMNNQPSDPVGAPLVYSGMPPAIALTSMMAINRFPFGRYQRDHILRKRLESVQLEAFRVSRSGTQETRPSYRVFLEFDEFGRVAGFRTSNSDDFRYSYQAGLLSEVARDGVEIFAFENTLNGFEMVHVGHPSRQKNTLPPGLDRWFPADPSWELSICEAGACYTLLGNHIVQVSYETPGPRSKTKIYVS